VHISFDINKNISPEVEFKNNCETA